MGAPSSRRVPLGTGLDYHLLEWDGAGSDHTVILVHGFLDLCWGWAPMVEQSGLDERLHLVAPDMRGHGDSGRIGAGGYYHFLDYLADLHHLIEQVGRGRVSLVGHSMGGTITSYYAGSYPDRIHKLALLEGLGPPEHDTPVPDRVTRWIETWRAALSKQPRDYATVTEAAARLRKHDPLLSDEMARFLADKGTVETETGGRRFKHDPLHLTMGPYPFRVDVALSFWQRIRCPTLLVDGSESVFRHRSDEVERRASAIAGHQRQSLTGAAHMMQRHQPAALGQLLADFLAD